MDVEEARSRAHVNVTRRAHSDVKVEGTARGGVKINQWLNVQ